MENCRCPLPQLTLTHSTSLRAEQMKPPSKRHLQTSGPLVVASRRSRRKGGTRVSMPTRSGAKCHCAYRAFRYRFPVTNDPVSPPRWMGHPRLLLIQRFRPRIRLTDSLGGAM